MAELVYAMCPGVTPDEMVMVGDMPETDGAFARTIGCAYALVLSGMTPSGTGVDAEIVEVSLAGVADRLLNN
jgi:ribonucleotide monophosphatase NagD (HAD superfamily)